MAGSLSALGIDLEVESWFGEVGLKECAGLDLAEDTAANAHEDQREAAGLQHRKVPGHFDVGDNPVMMSAGGMFVLEYSTYCHLNLEKFFIPCCGL